MHGSIFNSALKVTFVAITSFAVIYLLTSLVHLIRWIFVSRKRSTLPPLGAVTLWTALAVVISLQYASLEFHNYSLKTNSDSPSRLQYYPSTTLPSRDAEAKPLATNFLIRPRTFVVEKQTRFTLTAKADSNDLGDICPRITGTVDKLGYKREFTPKELVDGVASELNPKMTGNFNLQLSCDEQEIGTARFSVVLPPRTVAPQNVSWVLDAGDVVEGENGFELPIFMRAEAQVEKRASPYAVESDKVFNVADKAGNLATPIELTIPKNNAIGAPKRIPFSLKSKHSLVAYEKATGRTSNVLDASWANRGSKLDLSVYPTEIQVYSVPISSARALVYLTTNGIGFLPQDKIDILVKPPLGLKSEPSDKLILSGENKETTYTVSGGGRAGVFETKFMEPELGVDAALKIHVITTGWFFSLALLMGLVGVACGRGLDLFKEKGRELAISLGAATVAGGLLYCSLVMKWITSSRIDASILDYVPAAFIGIIGGYLGLGIFKIVIGALGLTSPANKPKTEEASV
jgi:hypothetical protein